MVETQRHAGADEQPSHLALRDGSWLVEPDQRPEFRRRIGAGMSHSAAILRASDPSYERHCAQHERYGVQPLNTDQWMAARAYADVRRLDIDEVAAEYMANLGRDAVAVPPDAPLTRAEELARDAQAWADFDPKDKPWLIGLTDDELVESGALPPKPRPAELEGYRRTNGRPDRPSNSAKATRERKRRSRARQKALGRG